MLLLAIMPLFQLSDTTYLAVQQIFKEAYVNKELVNIAFVGSASTGNDENGWSKLAKNELENYYGTNLLSISIYEFDGTSTDFLNSDIPDQIIDKNPDIVFLESFRLADNSGLVPVDIAQENLTTFIEQISTEIPEVAFIIQPQLLSITHNKLQQLSRIL